MFLKLNFKNYIVIASVCISFHTFLPYNVMHATFEMNANMNVSEQCRIAASKGNQVLGMIRRNISYKDKSLIVPLYKAIVRPHLEYCIQACISGKT